MSGSQKDTSRVEAFSDGVFAIAITLLILEIRVPEFAHEAARGALFSALLKLWPSFFAFVFSFAVILIMWINHHELFKLVRKTDYPFLFANGFLLLMVTFVPFPTAVLARYLPTPSCNEATAFYCGTFALISIAYNLLFQSIAFGRRLVVAGVEDEVLHRIRWTYYCGFFVYLGATIIAFWYPAIGLAMCTSLWLVWVRSLYRAHA